MLTTRGIAVSDAVAHLDHDDPLVALADSLGRKAALAGYFGTDADKAELEVAVRAG